jgi:N-methylhydantoinase A
VRIGVDAGGTFTDFVVLHDDGRLETFKIRSNPRAPASVIMEGIARAAGEASADVVHGSTVATNALLERKGARTAFVTTAGFEDIVHIGRQNRPRLYDLTPAPRRHLTTRELCFGLRERTYHTGEVGLHPSPEDLARLRKKLEKAGPESIAISLLHSYQNPENERAALEALAGLGYVCASHDISPEFREYERSATTLLNAYVGPKMDTYLRELERRSRHRISILQSNGGFLSASEARRHAVRTVLSGPAGGVIGAWAVAHLSGYEKALGFDMGGTSTDVSLSDGAPKETMDAAVDGIPLRVPMLDIHTVGAGGGSLARVDEGGLLRVGPESAGADPGPACYGYGDKATVTDAHVVLGRIGAHQFLGGAMPIDVARAGAALDALAAKLKLDRIQAAEGVLRIANANMERAMRVVSIERGYDPREFALVAFGGCGGLHACQIARELGIRTVLAPEHAGALSALGMLLSDQIRDYAAGALGRGDAEPLFRELEAAALRAMPSATLERFADVRYAGQSYELTVPWESSDPAAAFHREHQRVYGYSNLERAIEVVTLRLRARLAVPKPEMRRQYVLHDDPPESRPVYVDGRWREIPAYARTQVPQDPLPGPALLVDYGSTTLISSGWRFRRDTWGTVIVVADRY